MVGRRSENPIPISAPADLRPPTYDLRPSKLLAKRILDAGALRREHLRPIFRHVPVVFQTNPELPGLVNTGLVAERHARTERHLVARYQVRPLVTIHADPVP